MNARNECKEWMQRMNAKNECKEWMNEWIHWNEWIKILIYYISLYFALGAFGHLFTEQGRSFWQRLGFRHSICS